MYMKKPQALENIKKYYLVIIKDILEGGLVMEKSKDKSRSISFTLLLIGLIFIAGIFAYNYYNKSLGPVSAEEGKQIELEIPVGTSTNKISQLLYENGLIHNKLIFKLQVKNLGAAGKLKAGIFELNTSMNLKDIISSLSKGGKTENTIRFTIPEGYELYRIGEKLAGENIVDLDKFLELTKDKVQFEDKFIFLKDLNDGQSLEGFLFPSTYEIYDSAQEEEIIEIMLREFEKVYKKDLKEKLNEMDMDLNEAITLASIIEREGKLDGERPIMSAVFHNRIKEGMYLQSCATVQYILGERKEVLSTADTRIPSPYNTYINAGLPPGPISSPGEASIIAAVNPADVDYLFFVLTGNDGSHTFTRTYNEHLNAKPNK